MKQNDFIRLICLILFSFISMIPAKAQNNQNTTLMGRWANGPCQAATVVGSIVYFGNGAYLEIVDFADPAVPVELGKISTSGFITGVAVSGEYVYVVDGFGGLQIINASNLQKVAFLKVSGFPEYFSDGGVIVSGSHVFMFSNGIWVIDVSTPGEPQEVGFYGDIGGIGGMAVSNGFAYAYAGAYFRVIDVSNPNDLQQVGVLETGSYGRGVVVSNNLAYVVNYWDGLRVIDVSTPSNPVEVGFAPISLTSGGVNKVAVNGNYAYVVYEDVSPIKADGLRIIDVSVPTNPSEVGFFDTDGESYDVVVSGNNAYIADHHAGLRVIDVSTPATPQEVGFFKTGGFALNVAVRDNYAYLAHGPDGLRIIDVTSPGDLKEVGFFDTIGEASSVSVSSSYAYVCIYNPSNGTLANENGLRIIDISTPTNPNEVGSLLGRSTVDIVVRGDYAYVAYLFDGLRVIDVSTPDNPIAVGSVPIGSGTLAFGLAVSGNYAFLANWSGGLRIIDISTPDNPQEVSFFQTGDVAVDVAVSGNYAYVADRQSGLRIIDVSTPENPTEVGSFDTSHEAWGVAMGNSYAYIADGWDGLRVIDISTPTNPQEVGFFETGYWAEDVTVNGDLVYVADRFSGLSIIRNDLITGLPSNDSGVPITFVLYQNYPNPFNPTTVISYQLSTVSDVELTIYNQLGQEVRALVNERKPAGVYQIEWDGRDHVGKQVASGVYLYRLKAGSFIQIRKMVLLR